MQEHKRRPLSVLLIPNKSKMGVHMDFFSAHLSPPPITSLLYPGSDAYYMNGEKKNNSERLIKFAEKPF